jgi:carboxylate-amine ligase
MPPALHVHAPLSGAPRPGDAGLVHVSSFARSRLEPVEGRDSPAAAYPLWAHWNGGAGRRYTLGVEEEVMLLDPRSWSLAQSSDEVLAGLSDELAPHTAPETHAAVVELVTGVHSHVDGVVRELGSLRDRLACELDAMGLSTAAAGTHPLTVWAETEISGAPRYRDLEASMRMLARREPTMALHVHVGVPSPEDAVRVLNALRRSIPVLLALSANSPYWRSRDSGFASIRTPIFSMFPRVGIPRHFGSYAEYVHVVEELLLCEAVPDPGFLWWDARLQPRLGTVEVRIMDSQSRVADAASLAAIVQCLVRRHADARHPRVVGPEALAENRFVAARDGMRATVIEAGTGRRRPLPDALSELLTACQPIAASLGCSAELAHAPTLADDPGDARQRRLAAHHELSAVPALLGDEFAPARTTMVAA